MITEHHSQSPADTFKIGEKIGRKLKGYEIILLNGELGAGKTLLTKGIASALGIEPDEVVSPSFTLINEYKGKKGQRLIHVDLYRLGTSLHGTLPEIDDYIGEGIIVIEWAQYLDPTYFQLPNTIRVTIASGGSEPFCKRVPTPPKTPGKTPSKTPGKTPSKTSGKEVKRLEVQEPSICDGFEKRFLVVEDTISLKVEV